MAKEKSLSEVYSDVVCKFWNKLKDSTDSVTDLYSYADLQRLLDSNTRAAFREVGLKVDNNVVLVRLFFYLVMNVVGAYTTFFVHVEKSKQLLKVMLLLFFLTFSVYIGYDKVLLRRAQFVVKLKNCRVLVWSKVKRMDGTFELSYKKCGRKNRKQFYTVSLGELFFSDGECDYPYFVKLMEKLKPNLVALDSKGPKRD